MHKEKNVVELLGTVVSNPGEGYEFSKIKFVYFYMKMTRPSGKEDTLLVITKKSKMPKEVVEGSRISIVGSFENYRNRFDFIPTKYAYAVYAHNVDIVTDATLSDNNFIELIGYPVIVKDVRVTPLTNLELREVVLATNFYYPKKDKEYIKSCYSNCIAWKNTIDKFNDVDCKTLMRITGRLQSREYKKPDSDDVRTAYEISIYTAEKYEDVSED